MVTRVVDVASASAALQLLAENHGPGSWVIGNNPTAIRERMLDWHRTYGTRVLELPHRHTIISTDRVALDRFAADSGSTSAGRFPPFIPPNQVAVGTTFRLATGWNVPTRAALVGDFDFVYSGQVLFSDKLAHRVEDFPDHVAIVPAADGFSVWVTPVDSPEYDTELLDLAVRLVRSRPSPDPLVSQVRLPIFRVSAMADRAWLNGLVYKAEGSSPVAIDSSRQFVGLATDEPDEPTQTAQSAPAGQSKGFGARLNIVDVNVPFVAVITHPGYTDDDGRLLPVIATYVDTDSWLPVES